MSIAPQSTIIITAIRTTNAPGHHHHGLIFCQVPEEGV
jgi:hypothetical protein